MSDQEFLPSTWNQVSEMLGHFGTVQQENAFEAYRQVYQDRENVGVNLYIVDEENRIYEPKVEEWKEPREDGSYSVLGTLTPVKLPRGASEERYVI